MKLVRTDYGTRVLYYVDASAAEGLNAALSAAIDAVRAGTFDGVTLASASSVDESVVKTLADALGQTDCLLIFEGTPLLVSKHSAAYSITISSMFPLPPMIMIWKWPSIML